MLQEIQDPQTASYVSSSGKVCHGPTLQVDGDESEG